MKYFLIAVLFAVALANPQKGSSNRGSSKSAKGKGEISVAVFDSEEGNYDQAEVGRNIGGKSKGGKGKKGMRAEGADKTTKDIYFYAPPPEASNEIKENRRLPIVNRKNFKIIFIKAPSYSGQQHLASQAATAPEEKTIVYVLSAKPEIRTDVEVKNNKKGTNNKPEVYFIKYNDEQKNKGLVQRENLANSLGAGIDQNVVSQQTSANVQRLGAFAIPHNFATVENLGGGSVYSYNPHQNSGGPY